MRKIPVVLALAAGILINLISKAGTGSVILSGLGDFAFTVFSFLALIAVFNDISTRESSIVRKIFEKIKLFFEEEEIYFGFRKAEFFEKIKKRIAGIFSLAERPASQAAPPLPALHSDGLAAGLAAGLVEIQKDKTHGINPEENDGKKAPLAVLYIVSFIGIALWRIGRMFSVVPLSYSTHFEYGIAGTSGVPYALLLLVLFCIIVIYLKMRKTSVKFPADKTSHGMLMLLAYVSLLYAGVIGAGAVLNLNIFVVLKWVYYAASVYLIAALAVNILLGIFRKNVCNFEYSIIPRSLKADSGKSFFDSEEVRVNFSLKSLYTFKYTLKILPGIILSLGFVLLLSTTVFVVQPHQQAAVYRLGKLAATGSLGRSSIVAEGLHFKLPWPLDIAVIYDVHRINSLHIGESAGFHNDSGLLLLLGNGNEAVSVSIKIVYKISDLYSYLKTSSNPEAELKAAAYRALMSRTVNTSLDAFMSVDRSLLSASIFNELSAFIKAESLGLSVVQVIIEKIHPPVEVEDVYQRVATASIDKNTIITNARANAEALLIHAQQQSIVAGDLALAGQQIRVSAAKKEMAVYYEAMEAYRVNPRSFRLNRYLSTFETAVGGNKVYVFSPGTEDSIRQSVVSQSGTIFSMEYRR